MDDQNQLRLFPARPDLGTAIIVETGIALQQTRGPATAAAYLIQNGVGYNIIVLDYLLRDSPMREGIKKAASQRLFINTGRVRFEQAAGTRMNAHFSSLFYFDAPENAPKSFS